MRQPDSKFQYIQQAPTDICLLVRYPTFGKVWVEKTIFFVRSARESCFVPHLKIRGAAPALKVTQGHRQWYQLIKRNSIAYVCRYYYKSKVAFILYATCILT